MKKAALIILILLVIPSVAPSWDGYDWERGSYIEIDKGNLVREGRDIEIFDHNTGEYKDVEVQSIHRYGNSVEIEVHDYSTGEQRNFDMDSD